ncbi:MAG: phosphoenolpyruvate carboxykinase domain-containing protein, partial [Candidatus Binataceae bacterium]
LKWMLDRIDGRVSAEKTPVGGVPKIADIDIHGLEISTEQLREDMAIKPEEWKIELASAAEFFDKIGPTMPKPLRDKHQQLLASLAESSH